LEKLKNGKVPLEVIVRGKDADENAKQIEQCIDVIKKAGVCDGNHFTRGSELTHIQKKVGVLTKENPEGPLADEWKKAFNDISDKEEVDIAVALSTAALAIKDEAELISTRDASRTSARILKNYFVEEMSQIVDQEKTIKNNTLADKVMNKIEDSKFLTSLKISDDFHSENVDWATQPTVQSGGKYDLRFASEPDDQNMHAGVIVSALGIRYQSYASLVARTYLVDPSKEQEANYKFLASVHESIINGIRDGISAKEVYAKAFQQVKQKKPELEKHFAKNVGYGIGIETKDSTLMLSPKGNRTLKDGMTLVIQTSFSDIENKGTQAKKVKTYSLVIADTIRVAASKAINFTRDAKFDAESVCFFFDDSEEEVAEKPKAKKDKSIGAVASSNIVSKRLRADRQATDTAEKDAQRREHQKSLHARKQKEGLEKYANQKGALNGTEVKQFKRFQSYKREEDFPAKTKELIIVADPKSHSVVVPIMGRPVPFHISTIKNASTTAEGPFTSLRINFLSPGQGVGRKDDQPFEDPNAHFVRSLTFRSKDMDRMQGVADAITNMKKDATRREQEKKQLEDVIEQDKLIIDRRPQKLDPVFLRPALDGKRMPGDLQIHQNGLRYVHGMGAETVDVLFNNMRHLFFQPCKGELIVIIHIHLINPIMIGKRKTKDVQFYRDATDIAFDETGNRKRKHRYGDEEEFEAEEEERKRRMELDKLFMQFARKIEEADKEGETKVDVPVRDLGFNGVPSRSSVWVQPSADCLVQLTEPPFLVLTLDDIEVVHLERVQVFFSSTHSMPVMRLM
jgi:nucleosome binding factor SPN SPT16 subunit